MPSSVTLDRRLAQEQARHPGLAKSLPETRAGCESGKPDKIPPHFFAGEKNG
jgi:hypothetical protein